MFLHFTERVAGKFFDHDKAPRAFERRKAFAASSLERRRIAITAARHDIRNRYFAAPLIGLAGNRRFRDLKGMSPQAFRQQFST